MSSETTHLFDINELNEALIESTIKDVYDALEERGYNPTKQIVGYLISGDLGYISSYKKSRSKISKLDRNKIVEIMFKEYIK